MNAPNPNAKEPAIVAGSIEPIVNRTTKEIVGYRGRLPRSMSKAPASCKNPAKFRQWATPLCATRTEAIHILNAAIHEIQTLGALVQGQVFSDYAKLDIEERFRQSMHRVNHVTAANKRIQCWRNVTKNWLPKAAFWEWPPSAIRLQDVQAFVKWLETKARDNRNGAPLSASLIRNIVQQVRSVFRRANVNPESTGKLKQPPKKRPEVPNLTLEQQRKFFACKDIPIEDRIMAGIGMGLAVRVGELLALEAQQVSITNEGRGFVLLQYGGDHHNPLKGKGEDRTRRIELHEPGLGFLKIWLRDHYQGGVRLFDGPNGGYMVSWPEKWKGWTKLVGRRMHSHLMRHTYAVSMLSGTWGYPKKPLEFVKRQLGHTEIRTTEKYYADYAEGTWSRDVDEMVGSADGSEAPKAKPVIVTAAALLGLSSGLSVVPVSSGNPEQKPDLPAVHVDRWSTTEFPGKTEESEQNVAHDGPLCRTAIVNRFAPRRRRRPGGGA